jgi:hypothetical protein
VATVAAAAYGLPHGRREAKKGGGTDGRSLDACGRAGPAAVGQCFALYSAALPTLRGGRRHSVGRLPPPPCRMAAAAIL